MLSKLKKWLAAWLDDLTWRDYWRALRWSTGFLVLGWTMEHLFAPMLFGLNETALLVTTIIPNLSPDTLFWALMATSALIVWLTGIMISMIVHMCFPSETVVRCDGCCGAKK